MREEFSLRLIALVATVSGAGVATRAEAAEGGEPAPQLPKVAAEEQEEGSAEVPPATASAPATAEPDRKWQRDTLTLAAGVLSVPSYNGSDSNVLLPGLFVRGRQDGYSFSTRGTNLQVDLVRERRGNSVDVKFGPILNLRSERTGQIKDAQVRALGKLNRAFEVGGFVGIQKTGVFTSKHDQLGARVVVLRDVTGQHGSTVIQPSIEYGTPLSKTTYLGMTASATVVGKKFGRYYSDIDAAGSLASGLAVYQRAGAKGGLAKTAFGVALAQSLSGDLRKGWAVVAGAQYGRVQGRYAKSPIVRDAGKPGQWLAGIGVGYSF